MIGNSWQFGRKTSFLQAVKVMKNPNRISNISKSHTTFRMTRLCYYHIWNKANRKIHRTPQKKNMFDTIKELYVPSVMQIIYRQPTTMTAGIFNKHFYSYFYGLEVCSTIWKEMHLHLIHFSSLFTSLLCFKGACFKRVFPSHNL